MKEQQALKNVVSTWVVLRTCPRDKAQEACGVEYFESEGAHQNERDPREGQLAKRPARKGGSVG